MNPLYYIPIGPLLLIIALLCYEFVRLPGNRWSRHRARKNLITAKAVRAELQHQVAFPAPLEIGPDYSLCYIAHSIELEMMPILNDTHDLIRDRQGNPTKTYYWDKDNHINRLLYLNDVIYTCERILRPYEPGSFLA